MTISEQIPGLHIRSTPKITRFYRPPGTNAVGQLIIPEYNSENYQRAEHGIIRQTTPPY